MIGLCYDGIPIAGVIKRTDEGSLSDTYVSYDNTCLKLSKLQTGAYDVEQVELSHCEEVVIPMSTDCPDTEQQELIKAIDPDEVKIVSGAGAKFCHLLDGSLTLIAWGRAMDSWDICAGVALVTAAGATVTDMNG